jgi:hypothetical protein
VGDTQEATRLKFSQQYANPEIALDRIHPEESPRLAVETQASSGGGNARSLATVG